jgi:magnesium transporter
MKTTVFGKKDFGFDWISFVSPTEEELGHLATELGLLPIYIQDITQAEHLPKIEPIGEEGDSYFIITRVLDPNLGKKDFSTIQEATRKIAILYAKDQVVSIQRADIPWMEDLAQKVKIQPIEHTSFQWVCKLLKLGFRSFEPILLELSADLDFFEGKLFENERFPPFAKSLYAIRKKSSILKRLFTISSPIIEFIKEKGQADPIAQDTLDLFNRVHTMIEDVYERTVGLINLNLTINGQRSNEVMRFLTIYSAFFMPLTFLVGIYGMNFQFMPELNWKWGYALCWLIMAGIAGFHFWWFRRKNWL